MACENAARPDYRACRTGGQARHGYPRRVAGVGDAVGPYRIEAVLGEGGMGQVFRARACADRRRRRAEAAQAGLALSTPSAGCCARPRRARLEHRPVRARREVRWRATRAHAPARRADRAGIVTATSPSVLLDADGAARLTDFGLAKGQDYSVLTLPGQLLGTIDYLAPELIRGDEPTAGSDIYAFGCLVYACVAGQPAVRRAGHAADRRRPSRRGAARSVRAAPRRAGGVRRGRPIRAAQGARRPPARPPRLMLD